MTLDRIDPPAPLSEKVANRIREAIVRGEFRGGDRLRETDVAKQLGVSTIPVRDAFQQLEGEGLLSSEPRRGTFVRAFSRGDVEDIYRARAALEGLSYKMVCEQGGASPGALERLARLARQERLAFEEGELAEGVEADLAFHDLVFEETGSQVLQELWQVLRARFKIFIYSWAQDHPDAARERTGLDHFDLVQGLCGNDLEALMAQAQDMRERGFQWASTIAARSGSGGEGAPEEA